MRKLQTFLFNKDLVRFSKHVSFMLIMLISMGMYAQKTVSGVVQNQDGEPVPGATIQEIGTTNGALSGADGSYSISVGSNDAVLRISFLGFESQEISVSGKSSINVSLTASDVQLDDVVITALGIGKKEKSLGYAVTEVDGETLTQARETNVMNSLAGRVAGVNVSAPAAGPASSTRVIIRGNSSLAGNNQPLYVVDGIPIDNTNLGSAGMWGGLDRGDGISSMNPDDIETITVLKGPAATALYGTRAQNGVIQITTKRGNKGKGIGVELNSNYVWENPIDFYDSDDRQFVYGSGTQGQAPTTVDAALSGARQAWGARMEGQPVIQFNGENRPYSPNRNNLDNLFRTGYTLTNTLALSAGNANSSVRLSASDLRNEGVFDNVDLRRNTFNIRGTSKLGKRVSFDVKINYINEEANNRPALSDSPHNPGHVTELASSVDVGLFRPFIDENGDYIPYNNSVFRVNPYFGTELQFNGDTRDRLIGFASARYEFTDWLTLQLRAGTDYYTTRQTDWDDERTPHLGRPGRINEREWRIREDNYDFLLMFNETIGSDFTVSANLGGNRLSQKREDLRISGQEFIIPGLRDISNTAFPSVGYGISEKKINSLYGSAQIGYRDYLFLDVTARNDWSSTLPDENNSYFYPSASLSFAFTDAFDMGSDILSFGKVRASYAEVGGDTDPYQLDLTYRIVGQPFQGSPQGEITQGRIPLNSLRPTNTVSYEAGVDLRFFGNRLGIDFALYDMTTTDQILSTNISNTSGYGSVTVNAGEIKNTGIELLVTGTPLQTNDFRWDVALNLARNENTVNALDDDGKLEALRLGESRARNAYVEARIDQPYGAIVGRAYTRDDQGRIVHDADGLPIQGDLELLGVGVPDLISGLTNTFSYKGMTLSFLVDARFGGQIHSNTNRFLYSAGHHINTLEGREEFYAGTGGYVGEGVNEAGEVNTVAVDPEIYFGTVANQIAEEFIYDADFVKLRQATLTYRFPQRIFDSTPIQGLTLSVVGRNLWIISSNVPNVDPESNYNSTNAQGLEYSSFPTTRSFGVNLNVKF